MVKHSTQVPGTEAAAIQLPRAAMWDYVSKCIDFLIFHKRLETWTFLFASTQMHTHSSDF